MLRGIRLTGSKLALRAAPLPLTVPLMAAHWMLRGLTTDPAGAIGLPGSGTDGRTVKWTSKVIHKRSSNLRFSARFPLADSVDQSKYYSDDSKFYISTRRIPQCA